MAKYVSFQRIKICKCFHHFEKTINNFSKTEITTYLFWVIPVSQNAKVRKVEPLSSALSKFILKWYFPARPLNHISTFFFRQASEHVEHTFREISIKDIKLRIRLKLRFCLWGRNLMLSPLPLITHKWLL